MGSTVKKLMVDDVDDVVVDVDVDVVAGRKEWRNRSAAVAF